VTHEELRLFAVDHLMYELTMFHETAMRLKHDSALATDIIVKNALLESFTIHVRLLALFLYQKPNPKWPNDVTAEHYVKDIHAWRTTRAAAEPCLGWRPGARRPGAGIWRRMRGGCTRR
jgi:hypothetical protein